MRFLELRILLKLLWVINFRDFNLLRLLMLFNFLNLLRIIFLLLNDINLLLVGLLFIWYFWFFLYIAKRCFWLLNKSLDFNLRSRHLKLFNLNFWCIFNQFRVLYLFFFHLHFLSLRLYQRIFFYINFLKLRCFDFLNFFCSQFNIFINTLQIWGRQMQQLLWLL
jgi:hypothetical protein